MELLEYYEATDDETLFLGKIELIVAEAISAQESPFSCLDTHCTNFSSNILKKLTNLLVFIIGHSLTYLMPPTEIFGLCLKWTLDRYKITNQSIHNLADQYIGALNPYTQDRLAQIS